MGRVAGARSGRAYGIGVNATVDAAVEPAVLFGLLADTDRWNSYSGTKATRYAYELLDPAEPESRARVGHSRYLGVPFSFTEHLDYWMGARLWGERRLLRRGMGWLFSTCVLACDVASIDADGAVPRSRGRTRVAVVPRNAFAYLLLPFVFIQAWLTLRRYRAWLQRSLAALDSADAPVMADGEPPLAFAQLGARHFAPPRGPGLDTAVFRARAAEFARSPVAAEIQRRVLSELRHQPSSALVQMRPFEVARVWGADRREVLHGFLHAAKAGLVDLDWQVNCPTCRTGADVAVSLASLEQRVHCEECDVSFDVDFADNVEATFTVNQAIRPVERVAFCVSSPHLRPHVHGERSLAPGETWRIDELPARELLIRARAAAGRILLDPENPRGGTIAITGTGIERVDSHSALEDPLRIINRTKHPIRVVVERTGWTADIARGSMLVELPEFLELFGADAPATGMRLAVGTKAIVFTDVVGSTAMYRNLGDARAFALVQEHWRDARSIAHSHDGDIIKTLGDGMMLAFPSLANGVAAARELIDAAAALSDRRAIDFAIRVGVHEGPCFAARANDRLDLFGTTVNVAARLMDTAHRNQIALLTETAADAALSPELLDRAVAENIEVELRGLEGATSVSLCSGPWTEPGAQLHERETARAV